MSKQDGRASSVSGMPLWVKVFVAVGILFVVAFLIMHLLGGGFGGHGIPTH